jgi:hypothetical protein
VAGTPATAIHLPNWSGAICRNFDPRKLSLTFQKIRLKPDISLDLLLQELESLINLSPEINLVSEFSGNMKNSYLNPKERRPLEN